MIELIDVAVAGHMERHLLLQKAIERGRRGPEPENVADPKICRLGKWLYGSEIDEATRRSEAFTVVNRLHNNFHDCAGRIMDLARDFKPEQATALLHGEYKTHSDKLVRALLLWKQELLMAERKKRVA
ncbi:hypothetical protein RGUI_0561 [Rhodovulum sp. P5]|nr:hypothetical protein RGUI_0561 [Rhodovulum sp. P5]